MNVKKTRVKNQRLWKFGLSYLALSLLLLTVGLIEKWPVLPLMNVFIALAFLALANRFRALRVDCNGKTLLIVPDYATSTITLKDARGKVLARDFFPLFEEKTLETPCGTLGIRAIRHRFGKVELRIKAEGKEITLP
ncbi:conserved protein of unknown function [Thermococcus nautili]|uniref:hypothetical protein n=1 Tax=Thermococcus nautili TaxID=195522 RepID=UPI0025545302|nr:hypothetical protein [Thermococcus nautili]CAI1492241.1 conserved protein of unknown function [Thermococcus nautili]